MGNKKTVMSIMQYIVGGAIVMLTIYGAYWCIFKAGITEGFDISVLQNARNIAADVTDAINGYKNQIQVLQQTAARTLDPTTLANINSQIKTLQTQIDTTTPVLAQIQRIVKVLTVLQNQGNQLQSQIQQESTNLAAANLRYNAAQRQASIDQTAVTTAQAALVASQNNLNQATNQYNASQANAATTQQQIQIPTKAITDISNNILSLNNQVNTINTFLDSINAQKELIALQPQLDQVTKQLNGTTNPTLQGIYKNQINTLNQQIAKYQNIIKVAQANQTQLANILNQYQNMT